MLPITCGQHQVIWPVPLRIIELVTPATLQPGIRHILNQFDGKTFMQRTGPILCALVCALTLHAQTRIDLRTQSKSIDFAEAVSTRPLKTGAVLPAVCVTGELFFLTAAPAGQNTYGCAATNTWSAQSAPPQVDAVSSVVGKTGNVQIESNDLADCRLTRTNPTTLTLSSCGFGFSNRDRTIVSGITIEAVSGAGTAYIYAKPDGTLEVARSGTLVIACGGCTDASSTGGFPNDVARIGVWSASTVAGQWNATGTSDERTLINGPLQIRPGTGVTITTTVSGEKQIDIDSAIMQTKASAQAGQQSICNGSGAASAQTCSMSPALSVHTPGMQVRFKPGATNTGSLTLAIDSTGGNP